MKKILLGLLVLLLAAQLAVVAFAAEPALLLASASVSPTIVLPHKPTAAEENAASLLRRYVSEITELPAGESTAQAECRIYIDSADVQPPSGDDGAYRICEKDGDVYISGAGTHGALYGTFALLEAICGCRWYAHDLEVIPSMARVEIPRGYDVRYTPYFEYRETDWRSYLNPVYATANRMNGSVYRRHGAEWGEAAHYLSSFAHTLTNQFCAAASYFETHPEYYALRNGKRNAAQLCLTNPDVLRIVTQEVLDLLRMRYEPDGELQIVSLTQHDNQQYCMCPDCAAVDEANGSHAGTMLSFANAVADAVAEAGYTNVAIDTFAYQYTRKPPKKVVPRDNVIVRLCSIECCFGHPLDDPDCPENAKFMDDLRGWSDICSRIFVWDYGTNYGETFNFFANLHVLQRNMQVFFEHNVRGVYGEGNYYPERCDGEFSDLRCYLQCRLMADPYLDYDAEMNGFLRAFYGDGWESIREWIDLCCEKGVTKRKHIGIFQRAKGSLPGLTASDVRLCDTLWETAAEKAGTDAQRARVARSALCWRYWKASNGKGEFSILRGVFRRMQARDALYHDLVASGANCIGEMLRRRGLSDCAALHLLRIPFCWSTLYENPFWDAVSPTVEALYHAWLRLHV